MRNANVPPSHEAMLEAARIAADAHAAGNALLLQIPSSSAPLGAMGPPVGGLPGGEVVFPAAAQLTLFSQLNQLFPALAGQILQQQAQQSAPPSVGPGSYSFSGVSDDRPPSRNERSAKSGDNKSSAAYASRHQAAEQRRRTRINQKLEELRQLVPHQDRVNTACFLEEVIKYIQGLKARTRELEAAVAHVKTADEMKASMEMLAAPPKSITPPPPPFLQQGQAHSSAQFASAVGQSASTVQLSSMPRLAVAPLMTFNEDAYGTAAAPATSGPRGASGASLHAPSSSAAGGSSTGTPAASNDSGGENKRRKVLVL